MIDFYRQQLREHHHRLPPQVTYQAADGYFGKTRPSRAILCWRRPPWSWRAGSWWSSTARVSRSSFCFATASSSPASPSARRAMSQHSISISTRAWRRSKYTPLLSIATWVQPTVVSQSTIASRKS